jgi:hypothetical protein
MDVAWYITEFRLYKLVCTQKRNIQVRHPLVNGKGNLVINNVQDPVQTALSSLNFPKKQLS